VTSTSLYHGCGHNTANDGPPDIPIEPVVRESVDEFRERMAAKAARQRQFAEDTVKGQMSIARAKREAAGRLEAERFETPELDEADVDVLDLEPPAAAVPTPGPRAAPPARPATAPSLDERERLAAVTAYHAGDSIEVIAARTHRATGTVSGWLAAAGVEVRKGRRPDPNVVRPCAGSCGRMTRPASRGAAEFPDTVTRAKDGMCQSCVNAAAGQAGRYVGPTEVEQIAAAYAGGESAPEIGRRLGRNPATIRAALRSAGVELRDDRANRSGGRNAKTTQDDDPQLVAAIAVAYVERGLTLNQIVEQIPGATSAKQVNNVLRRAGIALRPSASGKRAQPRPDRTPSRPPSAPSAPAPLSTPAPAEPDAPTQLPALPLAPAAAAAQSFTAAQRIAQDVAEQVRAAIAGDVAAVNNAQRAALAAAREVAAAAEHAAATWQHLALARDLATARAIATLRAAAAELLTLLDPTPERNAS